MLRNDLVQDIDRVRDEIKDLFYDLQKKYPNVIFSGTVTSESSKTTEGELVSSIIVTINTTHTD
jgi:hypothetical protein